MTIAAMTGANGLAALAQDPERYVGLPEGSVRTITDEYCVVIGPQRRWAGVCRLRLSTSSANTDQAVREITELVSGGSHVLWNVGSSATPRTLVDDLRAQGLRDPDPPMDPHCVALVLTEGLPDITGPQVRRVETLEEHRAGLEIMLAAADWTAEAAASERARSAATYDALAGRGSREWLAWQAGEPVAYARAELTPAGLFMSGGATLPRARGRGCYRALVHARWREAVRLGLPGLAVQAQHATSAPILRALGFVEVATVHTLQGVPEVLKQTTDRTPGRRCRPPSRRAAS